MLADVARVLSDRVIVLDGAPAAGPGPQPAAGGATHAVLVRNGRPRALARLRERSSAPVVTSDLFARAPGEIATVSAQASLAEIGRRLLASDCEAVALTDDDGRFVGVVTQSSLLAALVEQQGQGRETNESFLRSLVENVPEIISLFKPDGTFTYVNRTVAGLSREQVLGHHITEFIPVERRADVQAIFDKVLATGQMHEYEMPGIGPNGTTSLYWCRVSPLRAGEKTVGLITLTSDISERHRAEEQARTLQNELAHVTRLTTMGEMASGLAHELNQPLAAIIAYADACQELVDSDRMARDQLLEVLRAVSGQAERAGKIIHRLRQLVRKSEPVRAPINVNDAIREVASLLEADAREAGAIVHLALDESLPPASADLIQIQQILLNLMRNGIDAMADTDPDERRLTVSTRPGPPGQVEITVCDRGHGLAPETQSRLFEPFFTTKPSGLGMGLPISRGIVEAHGGRLTFLANADGGVTVRCVLPTNERGLLHEPDANRAHRG